MKLTRHMVVIALMALILAACGGDGEDDGDGEGAEAAAGSVVLFSTQANPPEEQQAMIDGVFGPSGIEVEFVPAEEGVFVDRILSEAEAGEVESDLLLSLHGTYPTLLEAGALMDLSDLAAELADVGVAEDFLELGKLGTDSTYYIPVFQATYLMAAHRDALEYLPSGADINALTWDQLTEWAAAAHEGEGREVLGFPAAEQGLLHRFFQGYLYPSYTGGMVTHFDSPEALEMWSSFLDLWEHVSPQSNTYAFMQEPLLSGDVLIAFDHQARLVDALDQRPDDFVVFPAPTGPEGLGYMPVVVGLGIPEGSDNVEAATELIRYMLTDEGQVAITEAIGFFPATDAEIPDDAAAWIQAEATAAADQIASPDAVPSLLPIGLGERGGEFNNVYRNAFLRIVIDGEDIATVLSTEGDTLQAMLDDTGAPCWPPDEPSEGACQLER